MTQHSVEPLAWDTEFFGFPIGRVDLAAATEDSLRAIDADARAQGIECVYGTLVPTDPQAAYLVQRFGHRLVEVSIALGRPSIPFTLRPSAARVRRGTVEDLPQLGDALDVLAPWSRFAADPRFGNSAARRMHEAWVERAAKDGDEYMMLVAEDDDGITGVSTNVRTPVPRVDLMGVTKPGSGAAQALMAGLFEWAGDSPTEAGPIAARNLVCLRYVEHCGFDVRRTHYIFHRWVDEDAGTVT